MTPPPPSLIYEPNLQSSIRQDFGGNMGNITITISFDKFRHSMSAFGNFQSNFERRLHL